MQARPSGPKTAHDGAGQTRTQLGRSELEIVVERRESASRVEIFGLFGEQMFVNFLYLFAGKTSGRPKAKW